VTVERNKALARQWFLDGWRGGNVEGAADIFAPDFLLRGERVGPQGPQWAVRSIRAAFAGLAIDIDLQVAEGDMVVTRYTAHGDHVGDYRGVAATGRRVTASGAQIWLIRDGKVAEDWTVFDEWGLMSQISRKPGAD
jgi:predicted ester cyclase